jgi:hypothetical protein
MKSESTIPFDLGDRKGLLHDIISDLADDLDGVADADLDARIERAAQAGDAAVDFTRLDDHIKNPTLRAFVRIGGDLLERHDDDIIRSALRHMVRAARRKARKAARRRGDA